MSLQTAPQLPAQPTFAPEWAPQSAVQLTWPHRHTDWAYMLDEVTACYVSMAREISRREPLIIVTPRPEEVSDTLRRALPPESLGRIRLVDIPTNDTWARDHAFLTLLTPQGPRLLNFAFNGWGGKFEATLDNLINPRLYALCGHETGAALDDHSDFVLEGGSVETDGRGTVLTTSRCLLNPNRGAGRTRQEVERQLSARLHADRILWLDHGELEGDDTDAHIDTLARLCPDDTILYVRADDPLDPHYGPLSRMEQQLASFLTPEGRPYRLCPLPMPRPIHDENGERLPATYANYLVINGAVLCPTYGQSDLDARAAEVIHSVFPDREVVGIDCRPLIRQHGSLHCATMQYPVGVFPPAFFGTGI